MRLFVLTAMIAAIAAPALAASAIAAGPCNLVVAAHANNLHAAMTQALTQCQQQANGKHCSLAAKTTSACLSAAIPSKAWVCVSPSVKQASSKPAAISAALAACNAKVSGGCQTQGTVCF